MTATLSSIAELIEKLNHDQSHYARLSMGYRLELRAAGKGLLRLHKKAVRQRERIAELEAAINAVLPVFDNAEGSVWFQHLRDAVAKRKKQKPGEIQSGASVAV